MDEIDVGFQGAHRFKERITYKKAGDGFLVYALCDPNGYLYSFIVKFDSLWKKDWFGLSKTFSAVVELVKRIPSDDKWHHVFFDNLYGNVNLAKCLLDLKFKCTSTMRLHRIPKVLKMPQNAQRGHFVFVQKDGVVCLIWKDKKDVKFCTTGHSVIERRSVERKRGVFNADLGYYVRTLVPVEVLNVSQDYNDNMNGVDVHDQYRCYYNVRRRNRKWWMPLFFWILDSCISNAYICYVHYWKRQPTTLKLLSHAEFRANLCSAFAKGRKRRKAVSSPERRRNTPLHLQSERLGDMKEQSGHWLVAEQRKPNGNTNHRFCYYCKIKHKISSRTIYFCERCDVALHIGCMKPYHTE
jgi:hypothetical protein